MSKVHRPLCEGVILTVARTHVCLQLYTSVFVLSANWYTENLAEGLLLSVPPRSESVASIGQCPLIWLAALRDPAPSRLVVTYL